jgi:insulysin
MINILKSDSDKRDYKYIELDNKLKVILVNDKLSMSCGALLNINVGSINDTLQGMAHFLEHMVFMGSSKYPNQNNFMQSVFKSGGITNAMTGDTHTSYYFTIETDKYMKNLDMLAYFFIDPLLRKDNIEKEVNAVNAESIKNTSDDNWIFQEMIKKTLNENHPINHYTCGNNDTLKGDDLDIKVREFYETYYSANIMQLVLFINDKINEEEFIKYIIQTFGKIKNKEVKLNNVYGNLLIPNNIVKYIPVTDIDSLTICTELPKNFDSIQTSSIDLLNWIITSKTENSLFKKLEDKGLLTDIDCAEIFTFDDKILYITEFTLTEKGIKEYDRIIRIYFDYIKSILKCTYIKDIYNDLLKKYRREYNLSFSEDIVDSLLEINILLNKNINPIDINTWVLNKPEFQLIQNKFNEILTNIKLINSSFILRSKNLKLNNHNVDKIYRTKYILEKIEPIEINKKKYDIINVNRFLSDKFIINKGNDNFPLKNPIKLSKPFNCVYNFNSSFSLPDVNFYVSIKCPNLLDSPEIYIKSMLYIDSIYSDNSDIINEIEKAGYKFAIKLENDTFLIYINSDNNNCEKIINILQTIFNKNNKSKGFKYVKEKIFKKYKSYLNEKPLTKISSLINKILLVKYYTPYDLIDFILDADFQSCKDIFFNIFNKCTTSMLISGNLDKADVDKYADKIYNILDIKTELEPNFDTELKELKYPYIKKYINKNKEELNNLFTLSFKLFSLKKSDEDCIKNIAFLNILNAITNMQYFSKLRTEEQYGYIVNTKISYIGNNNLKTGTIKCIVQSPVKSSEFLLNRTLEFIKIELKEFITKLDEEQFNDYKNGEINNLSDIYHNLSEIDIFLCTQIFDFSYKYDYKIELTKYIKNMSKENFIEQFNKLILNNLNYFSISIDSHKKS